MVRVGTKNLSPGAVIYQPSVLGLARSVNVAKGRLSTKVHVASRSAIAVELQRG